MNRILLLSAALVITAATACTTKIDEGNCSSDADCANGTICNLEQKFCVKREITLCQKPCGDGFLCQEQADHAQKCVVEEGHEPSVIVTAPSPRTPTNKSIPIICEAKGPQFKALRVFVTAPGGTTTDLPTPVAKAGVADAFETTFDAEPSLVVNGEHTVTCELEFGPEGETQKQASAPVIVLVDKAKPVVTHTAPAGWHRRSETLSLEALIAEDAAQSGVDDASVRLKMAPVDVLGIKTTGTTYAFAVSLATVSTATTQGPVSYTIEAADKATNKETITGAISIDAVPPVVVIAPDTTWHGAGQGSFNVTATITVDAEGAPLKADSVKLAKPDGSNAVTGTAGAANTFTFAIDPAAFSAADSEGDVDIEVTAEDLAGNVTKTAGKVKIDHKAPTITITPDTAPHKNDVPLNVAVTDGGSNIDEASVRVQTAAGEFACAKAGAIFVCTAKVDVADGTEEPAYAVTIKAKDLAGNVNTATTTLKIDRKGPVVTVTADGKWYARGDTVIVRATSTDSSGFASASAPTLTVTAGTGKTFTGTVANDGALTFNVLPAQFAPAGATTPAVSVTVHAFDALGNASTTPLATNQFGVDDQAPTISTPTVQYPGTSTQLLRRDPAGGTRDTATITATVSDGSGSGVKAGTVLLSFPKKGGGTQTQAPTGVSGTAYLWTFKASDPEFNLDAGNIAISVVASDDVGNAATPGAANVSVTRKLWDFATGRSVKVNGGIALSGSAVFFTLAGDGPANNVFAINAADGSSQWASGILGTPTTPITVGATKLYFASDIGGGSLHAFSPTQTGAIGVQAWACSGYGIARGALASATVNWQATPSETIFYASDEPNLYAFRRNATNTDCDTKGTSASSTNGSSGAVSHHPGTVYVAGTLGKVARIDLTTTSALFGAVSTATGGSSTIPGVPLDSAGLAFLAYSGHVTKLSSSMTTTFDGVSSNATGGQAAPPSLGSDSRVYVGSESGFLSAFDTSSTTPAFEKAITNAAGTPKEVRTSPAVGNTGTIYFGANDAKFHALSSTGVELWAYSAGANLESSPALDCKGVAYFGTANGHVIALITDSTGLAASPWPKYQHDNQNTGSTSTSIACP